MQMLVCRERLYKPVPQHRVDELEMYPLQKETFRCLLAESSLDQQEL